MTDYRRATHWPAGAAYLAGPMRGIPSFNFPAFFMAEQELVDDGVEVYNPARHDQDVLGFKHWHECTGNEDLTGLGITMRQCLGTDLAYICERAKWICVLPGWETSRGASAEVATAIALGMPVVDFVTGDVINPSLHFLAEV